MSAGCDVIHYSKSNGHCAFSPNNPIKNRINPFNKYQSYSRFFSIALHITQYCPAFPALFRIEIINQHISEFLVFPFFSIKNFLVSLDSPKGKPGIKSFRYKSVKKRHNSYVCKNCNSKELRIVAAVLMPLLLLLL